MRQTGQARKPNALRRVNEAMGSLRMIETMIAHALQNAREIHPGPSAAGLLAAAARISA
jgi:hypothetical protein